MKTKVLMGVSVLALAAWTAQAVEDGLGTNVVKNIRIQTNGVIDLGGTPITNWNQVGSTSVVAALQDATNALNASATNVSYQVTNDLYNATNALNTSVTTVSYQVTNNLYAATNALNSATGALNTAVGKLTARTNYWNNGVIIYKGIDPAAPLVAGKLYYMGGGSVWSNAYASTNATAQGLIGLAMGTTVAEGLLLNGQFDVANTYTVGAPLYLQTNDNVITEVRPFRTNHVVRIVGYAINDGTIMFNPDRTYIEILSE